MNVVCFHNPDEENGWLSNWHPSAFVLDRVKYSSLEQYMMHAKARLFGDERAASEILAEDDVARIKQLGRLVKNYDERHWNGVRQIVVYQGLCAKFLQNPDLEERLASTGSALLAECTVRDRIWGIGLSMTDPGRFEPARWKGQNLLGYALMMVRAHLACRPLGALPGQDCT